LYDIAIIGAGPTGLFAAFYAGFREMKTLILDARPEPGGQVTALYPAKFIYDVPGLPKILGKDLVKHLVEQGCTFNPTQRYSERVETLTRLPDNTLALGTSRATYRAHTLLIAGGVGAFEPKKLDVPGAEKFEGRGVFYFVKDKNWFRGKKLLIVGGGDSAVDWALNLQHWASHVTLIHRREGFRAHEGSVAELKASKLIDLKLFYELKAVHGGEQVEAVTIFHNKTQEEMTLPMDAVLLSLGYNADIGPLQEWGLQLQGKAIVVNVRMETNLPGVYAAGDIAALEGLERLNLMAIGFAQATIAVNYAKKYIDPTSRVFPGHSSEKKL